VVHFYLLLNFVTTGAVEPIFGAGVNWGGPKPLPRRSDSGKNRLGIVSRCTGSRRRASFFCPARFLRSRSLFCRGRGENETYKFEALTKVEESRPASTIYRKVGSKRGASEALSLVGQ
jgi:hypothetical protein